MENESPAPAAQNEAPQQAQAQETQFTPGIANAPQEYQMPSEQPQDQQSQAQASDATQQQPVQQDTQTQAQATQDDTSQVDYDAYLDSLISQNTKPAEEIKVPTAPTAEQLESDDQALTKFFGELVDTAVQKALNEGQKQTTIREAEQRAWNDVFGKYPEIKDSKGLRDTIHNIRVGAYQRGQALSPLQVADQLIGDLHEQYKKGVNDTNVTTTIRDSQPLGGGTQAPTAQPVNYARLHDGGEAAAIDELTKLMSQGKI